MKTSDRQGNGSNETVGTPFTTQVMEENPYLKRTVDESARAKLLPDDEALNISIEDEHGPPTEPSDLVGASSQRRRRLALLGMVVLLLLSIALAVALYRRSSTRVEYGRAAKQGDAKPSPTNNVASAPRDSRTDKAIAEAQQLTVPPAKVNRPTPPELDLATSPDSKGHYESPFKIPAATEGALGSSEPAGSNQQLTSGNGVKPNATTVTSPNEQPDSAVCSQRSAETSLYMTAASVERLDKPSPEPKAVVQKKRTFTVTQPSPTAPTFGSMLPVRTVGALYSLRTGALVRLELTREMKGDGWSLKRGTILVGNTKGSDFDRAYVSLVGFIDPDSGKLVKLGGDLLGSDGATGLKGKRRQIDGGWTKALKRFASSALDVTGTVLSGRGRDTVILTDGVRTRAMNPITDEVSGVLDGEVNIRQTRGFVEVLAGTSGYVLVTDLPSTATPEELSNTTLSSLTDIDSTRPATGLTEHELADLLSNGSSEQIRAAMPRMTPEMRKIAQLVLNQ